MYWSELITGIYPWDIHDEGLDTILDNLQQIVGCNAAYLIGLMHHEKRPCNHNYYPHNPVRKRYLAEDSRTYWHIHEKEYQSSRIKPLPSDRDFLKGKDWLEIFSKGLRSRGMKVGVEISHTPLDAERGEHEFADCIQRDIYGNPPDHGNYTNQQLCWNSPDAREYVCALARDLVRNYDVDFVQTCSFLFNPGRADLHPFWGVILGGCFCDNCRRQAEKDGLDWEAIVRTARRFADQLTHRTLESNEENRQLQKSDSTSVMYLIEHPEIYQWLAFRCRSVTRYFEQLSAAMHGVRKDIEFRFNTCWPEAERYGQDLTQIKEHVQSIRMMDYIEQRGDITLLPRKEKWLANVRRQVGEEMKIIGGIAPRGKATPEIIRKSIFLLADNGVDGLSFGFYDCAPFENLRAIRQGMEEAGVVVVAPDKGPRGE